ncbi:RNA polymerase sigma factor [Kribbella sp. NPDC026611]|uniref:RNA polymerase sigma factor n=1 Tax=Kribbella sp. NPDC026611 TaxID=3154911 RepID=UPI0033C98D3D
MADDHRQRFEALYAATLPQVLGYALRRCDNAEDAADVAAETFAIAWRRLSAVPDGDEARLWLYGVARKVLANHRRRAGRRRDLSARLAAEVAEVYEEQPRDDGELAVVGRAFRALPPADRELLSLVAWEGLGTGEIATVLGCSRNAVRIRLHRARRRLSHALSNASEPTTTARTP